MRRRLVLDRNLAFAVHIDAATRQRLPSIGGAFERHPRNDGPAGEQFRIVGKHHGRHGSTGREARHVDAMTVDVMRRFRFVDHVSDGKCLAPVAVLIVGGPPQVGRIGAVEPVEAQIRIVEHDLLRHHQDETPAIGQGLPARLSRKLCRSLRAAVKRDDEGGGRAHMIGDIFEHAQVGEIRSETRHLGRGARGGGANGGHDHEGDGCDGTTELRQEFRHGR